MQIQIDMAEDNKIEWDKVDYFAPDEFSENPNICADPYLIYALDKYRQILGKAVHPSPVKGALARFTGSPASRHFAAPSSSKPRLSIAIDVFCETDIFHAWTTALHSGLWKGVGVYFDTQYKSQSWCMLHLDRRPIQTLWYRDNKTYYTQKDKNFWNNLSNYFEETSKR